MSAQCCGDRRAAVIGNPLMKKLSIVVLIGLCAAQTVEAGEAMLLRLFLADGSVIVSYGEYARVGERVVFSMPLGGEPETPGLQLVNLPASVVDWDRTARYADSARAAHYAGTQGEPDYAQLTASVARTLNDISVATNDKARLQLALAARRELEQWPSRHYGYRAADVREILAILDEVIAELRAAAGETRFDLNLVATAEIVPPVPLLPPPTLQDSIGQAMAVARLSDVPADRISLLSSIVGTLNRSRSRLPAAWVDKRRHEALDAMAAEARFERAYGRLTEQVIQAASNAAERADVVKIEALLKEVERRDGQLGYRRPAEVSGLLVALQVRLDVARGLRLARDRWLLRRPAVLAYQSAIKTGIDDLSRSRSPLDAIRRLAGPDASVLTVLAARLETAIRRLEAINPPEELNGAHALLLNAARLAASAVDVRRDAIRSGDIAVAWDASAAAAGAIMLFSKARGDMDSVSDFPQAR
jgi:hypothetical protein